MKNVLAYSCMGIFLVFTVLGLISHLPILVTKPVEFYKAMKLFDVQWFGLLFLGGMMYYRRMDGQFAHGVADQLYTMTVCLGIIVYGSQLVHIPIMHALPDIVTVDGPINKLVMQIGLRSSLLLSLFVSFLIFRATIGFEFMNKEDDSTVGASKNNGKFKETKFKKTADIDNAQKQKPGDVIICWDRQTGKPVIIPEKDRSLHLFCVGPTGSGKSSTLVLPMIYQDLKVPHSGIGLIEPKGDIAELAYKMALLQGRTDAIFFNPVAKDTIFFNPLDPMNGTDYDVINLMTTVYDGMAGGANTDQFFHKNSMMVLRKALDLLLRTKRLDGNILTLRELGTFLSGKTQMSKYCKQLASHRRPEDEAILTWFYEELLADTKSAGNNAGYYIGLKQEIELLAELSWLNGDPKTGKSQLNFDHLLANGGIFFASTGFGELGTMGNYLGQFLIMAFQNAVFRRPGTEDTRKPFFMYIDEFSLYANENFERWLALARSYRCPAHLFTQGTSQLEKVSPEFRRSAINNCRHKVIFAPEEEEEARYWSEYFGETYKEKVSKSNSKGSSKQFKMMDLLSRPDSTNDSQGENISEELVKNYTSTDVMNMPFRHIIYKTVRDGTNQPARYGMTDFIPEAVNKTAKSMTLEEIKAKFKAKKHKVEIEEIEDVSFD